MDPHHDGPADEAWEAFDPMMNAVAHTRSFNDEHFDMQVKMGPQGLIRLLSFLAGITTKYGVSPLLYEDKVRAVIAAIERRCVQVVKRDKYVSNYISVLSSLGAAWMQL